ncbi:BA75_01503T0 [Komagataella pastoris]|uniref:Ribonuclease n=1 Tax=Komagataella pastoris TaxID=4922 RepID=A0A1B2J5G9_PICPA|nr:BA75_01503T0 [Komagataella pastoris]
MASTFIPPSVPEISTHRTTTYVSEIPESVLENPGKPCCLGVDEAGRGPVVGPMVYGVSYCLEEYEPRLKDFGFADSKTLTEQKRSELLESLCNGDHELRKNVGWATTSISACDISSAMLKPHSIGNYNLNEQAHDVTMELIDKVLQKGVNLRHVFVDTVGPPASYQKKLQQRFPALLITVSKKADAIYPCVSSASVCAKVTRDVCLRSSNGEENLLDCGSGYPSDPNTKKWLAQSIHPLFGWSRDVRFSWQTAKDCLEKHNSIKVVFGEEEPTPVNFGDLGLSKQKTDFKDLEISTSWWGH